MFSKSIIFIFIFILCLFKPLLIIASTDIVIPQNIKLVGKANLSVLWWKVYKSELYTLTGQYQENIRPLVLKLTYQRSIKKEKLVKETRSQWKSMKIDLKKQDVWAEQLTNMWPDVKKKDSITFYVNKQNISYFYFNDKLIGSIQDTQFAKAFGDIWLADGGEYPSLTKKLTGKSK